MVTFYLNFADSAGPPLNGHVKEKSMCTAAVVDCWVCVFNPLHVWEMACLSLTDIVSVSRCLSRTFLNTCSLTFLTLCPQRLKPPEPVVSDPWYFQVRQQECIQKSPVPSAKGLPDRRKLSGEAVSGILPVSDSRFFGVSFKWWVQCQGCLWWGDQCLRLIEVLLITFDQEMNLYKQTCSLNVH